MGFIINPFWSAASMGPPSGAALWLKADSLALSNNDPVGLWTDSSGNGHHVSQSGVGEKPLFKTNQLNGYPGVLFDGVDDRLIGNGVGSASTTVSLFSVIKFNNTGIVSTIFHIGEDDGYGHLQNSSF